MKLNVLNACGTLGMLVAALIAGSPRAHATAPGAIAARIYFIESKYQLLFRHKDHDDAIPRGVPFALESLPLPQ